MPSLRERRTERPEDRRIIGGRAQKLAIDAGRIVEPTRGYRLGGRSLQGCRVRHLRCRGSRVERKHEDQRWSERIHLVPLAGISVNSSRSPDAGGPEAITAVSNSANDFPLMVTSGPTLKPAVGMPRIVREG